MTVVLLVSLDRLRTSLAPLRGSRTDRQADLASLPLRVAEVGVGHYEVVDGFKRLARWAGEGQREIPVVVESARGITLKARLLEANAGRRTTSAMDEARVVASLVDEDRLSATAVAKLLGRKKTWVARRLLLAGKLAPELKLRLDAGRLCLTVAVALCEFDRRSQVRLADVSSRHGLSTREALAFLVTYRMLPGEPAREDLLRDPRCAQPQASDQGSSPLGAAAARIEARLDGLEAALGDLSLLMKGEVLPAGTAWEGIPARPERKS